MGPVLPSSQVACIVKDCCRLATKSLRCFKAPSRSIRKATLVDTWLSGCVGTPIGWIWVGLMATVAASSLWIHEIRLFGPWSPIHLLSIYVLIMLPVAVIAARRHNVRRHRLAMIGMFTGGLVIAGLFTFLPGRIMHAAVFGQ